MMYGVPLNYHQIVNAQNLHRQGHGQVYAFGGPLDYIPADLFDRATAPPEPRASAQFGRPPVNLQYPHISQDPTDTPVHSYHHRVSSVASGTPEAEQFETQSSNKPKRGRKKATANKVESEDEDGQHEIDLSKSASDVTLYFNNRDEAVHGMKAPNWSPPDDDETIPDTDEKRQDCVRKLVAAMLDLSKYNDKDGSVFKKRWYVVGEGRKDFYDPKAIEKVCWDILVSLPYTLIHE